MDLASLVGAQLAVGLPGPDATDDVITHLRQTATQSLVVFERNFSSAEQFVRLIRRLEEALGRRLLVMVDHEGGRVIRFSQGVTRFPDALSAGRHQEVSAIERQGAVEAEELKQLRVQVNLAPCVDVLVDGSDPVVGDRSYGADSDGAGRLGSARIHGLQSHGVAACAKHFPGLGAVQRDPHKTLPTIPLDWTAMRAVHLPPFEAAIAAGVATVMSSHVCYPALGDPAGLPATFSPRLIRGLLRETMGFAGVSLTDDLMMGALRTFGAMGEIAVRAVEAGHDVLLICADLAAQQEALSGLLDAYRSGRLKTAELEASVGRVTQLRQKYLS